MCCVEKNYFDDHKFNKQITSVSYSMVKIDTKVGYTTTHACRRIQKMMESLVLN